MNRLRIATILALTIHAIAAAYIGTTIEMTDCYPKGVCPHTTTIGNTTGWALIFSEPLVIQISLIASITLIATAAAAPFYAYVIWLRKKREEEEHKLPYPGYPP